MFWTAYWSPTGDASVKTTSIEIAARALMGAGIAACAKVQAPPVGRWLG